VLICKIKILYSIFILFDETATAETKQPPVSGWLLYIKGGWFISFSSLVLIASGPSLYWCIAIGF